jgi:hypothetical protein
LKHGIPVGYAILVWWDFLAFANLDIQVGRSEEAAKVTRFFTYVGADTP